MLLNDGTIIPSWLGVMDTTVALEPDEAFDNVALRIGEVKELIYPGDRRSVSRKWTEYRVLVQHRDRQGRGVTTEYPNCALNSTFGGVADKSSFTLRPKLSGDHSTDGLGKGSKVVILCINGETNLALIIGGFRDPADTETDTNAATDLHHLLWEFNGIRADINNDGELSLEFKGPTQADGTLAQSADPDNSGAMFQLLKNGNIVFSHAAQTLTFDHQNKKLVGTADSAMELTVNDGPITLTANNVLIGGSDANQALVMGTVYRQNESQCNQTLIQQLTVMATLIQEMSIAATIAGAGISGAASAHSAPIVGPIIGAPLLASAGVGITTIATSLASMGTAVAQMFQAIAQLEASTDLYLSKKNTTD